MAFSFSRIAACALLAALFTSATPASAQDTAPIRLIVGAPPGGTTDMVARGMAQYMAPILHRTLVVENRPGAGGNIAADYVAKSKADGNTLLVTFTSFSVNPSLYKHLPFDPIKDFTPISMLATVPSVLVVRKDFPAKTMPEFITQVKANPGKYTAGIGAIGSSLHMAGERMKMMAGLNIRNIPYKGTNPALTDLLGGQVDMMFASSVNVLQHVKSGSLRALGVTSPQPLPEFPGVPPIGKTIPGFESSAWFGLLGPAKLTPSTLSTLNRAAREALQNPTFRKMLEREAAIPVGGSAADLASFIRKDIVRYAELVKYTGAKPE
ncbi:MAG: Bug family tripartite tricarboxylate transporter substrate binding protein [Bordetella sp.]|uniref:Bug family tripartite tricarboxylate transporter substrate binding protein n=1 Tax=Bordetella sp. TaxID=28081 RepID=UPI003F7C936C